MKLVIAVVQESDANEIMDALIRSGIKATQITSAGGFLREENATLLIGIDATEVQKVIGIIDENSTARRMFVNPLMPMAPVQDPRVAQADSNAVRVGASVFVVNVRRFARLTE